MRKLRGLVVLGEAIDKPELEHRKPDDRDDGEREDEAEAEFAL